MMQKGYPFAILLSRCNDSGADILVAAACLLFSGTFVPENFRHAGSYFMTADSVFWIDAIDTPLFLEVNVSPAIFLPRDAFQIASHHKK